MPIRVPLKYGCVAEVLTEDSDRPPYVPPPVQEQEHHPACRCERCQSRRATQR